MKRRSFLLAFGLPALLAVGCVTPHNQPAAAPAPSGTTQPGPGERPTTPTPPAVPISGHQTALPKDLDALVKSQNQFATKLYGALDTGDGNFAMSPASISLAFGMTFGGARKRTRSQMASVLHFSQDANTLHRSFGTLLRRWNSDAKRAYELRVANRLFGEKTRAFLDPFLALTADHYGAELQQMDFKNQPEDAREAINKWIEDQTKQRISKLLPPKSIKKNTGLVLANAIYFKGEWITAFPKSSTKPADFFAKGATVQAQTMNLSARLRYGHADGVKMLQLPYKGGDLAMQVLLPDQRDGMADLERKLSADNLGKWASKLASHKVIVALPRFKVDPPKPLSLSKTLFDMGMADVFDLEKADLTGMAKLEPNENLFISAAFHKAFVEVDEKGTEAAAATAIVVGVGTTSVRPRIVPKRFIADHPFLFLIRDLKTDAILFIGRVADPTRKG